MAFVTGDRVKETTTSNGTGGITLAGAVTQFRAFSDVASDLDLLYYAIVAQSGGQWEVGLGTWSTGGTITRVAGQVLSGSAGAATLVNFSAGTKDVFITVPAADILQLDNNSNFNLPSLTAVTTPAAGNISVFARSVGGRMLPAFAGPSGLDSVLQPHLGRNRRAAWQPIGNATTVPILDGVSAPTALGTGTARSVATTNIATRIKRLGYVSAATAGAFAGHFFLAGAQQYAIGNGAGLGGFHHISRFVVSDAAAVSGARQFIGWQNVVTTPTNVEPNSLINCFGLAQLSTDATQWYIVHGGSAAQTAIALGTSVGAPTLTNTAWDLSFFCPPSSNNIVHYMLQNLSSGVLVSGTITGTAGTVLPLSTALLALRAWRTNNATLLAVGLDIASHYIETDQ